jgi:predicted GNAT family acetyltransferase
MQPTEEQFVKEGDYLASVRYATEQNKMAKLAEVTFEYRKKGYGTANVSKDAPCR